MPTTVRLEALQGRPLIDMRVRETVLATARAIAERIGVEIIAMGANDHSVTVTLDAEQVAALGFAAELRRLTNAWYRGKYKEDSLWGEPDA